MIWTIGIDIGGTKIWVASIDKEGNLLQHFILPTSVSSGYQTIKSEILETISTLISDVNSPPLGVGIGIAGQIDPHAGIVHFAPNLNWHEESLLTDISQALNLPVVVLNDVRAGTWGEWKHGAGKGCDDLVCLFVGTGIGGGIVCNGRIKNGSSNTAAEFGHMRIHLNGAECTCGGRGCLEAYAGGWSIAKRAKEAGLLAHAKEPFTAQIVIDEFKKNNPLAKNIIHEVEQALITGCINIVHAINPSRLILGGGVIQGLPELVDGVEKGVREGVLPAATTSLQIVAAKLPNANVIGAAAAILEHCNKSMRG